MAELEREEEDADGHIRVAMGQGYKEDDAMTTDVLVSKQIYNKLCWYKSTNVLSRMLFSDWLIYVPRGDTPENFG